MTRIPTINVGSHRADAIGGPAERRVCCQSRERFCKGNGAADKTSRRRWQFLWLLVRGFTATTIASGTGYSAYWIGQIARRYNDEGPDGIRDRRHRTKASPLALLSEDHQQELRDALTGPAPGGDRWCGRTVAAWIGECLGRRVPRQSGWRWLRQLGARWRKPRPRHVSADPAAQQDFKQLRAIR